MPLYEAACTSCGHEHEYIQTMAKCHIVPKCPKCGRKSVKSVNKPPAVYGDLNDFSNDPGGKGRWHPQLRTHVTSVKDAIVKAEKRGWSVLDKA